MDDGNAGLIAVIVINFFVGEFFRAHILQLQWYLVCINCFYRFSSTRCFIKDRKNMKYI